MLQEARGDARRESRRKIVVVPGGLLNYSKDVASIILETGMKPDEVFDILGEDLNLNESFIFIREWTRQASRER